MRISCIIPVYNSEKYIAKCVKSIILDKRSDIEVILVDDGSVDKSGKICDELAKKDNRIKVIHQENKGICGARNAGIECAQGEWLCFIDNDDIIDRGAWGFIFENLDAAFDIIYYGFDEFRNEKSIVYEDLNREHRTIILENEDIQKLQWDCLCRYKDNHSVMSARLLTTPWGKIYRREFIDSNKLRFVDGMRREEDVSFNLMCLAKCNRAKYVDYKMYHYRQFIFSESHSYKKNIVEDSRQALSVYQNIIGEYYHNRKDMQELYNYRILWELLYCVVLDSAHVNNPKKYKERKRDFQKLFEIEEFDAAIKKCDISRLGYSHRILAKAIRKRNFFMLCLLSRAENILNNIRYH